MGFPANSTSNREALATPHSDEPPILRSLAVSASLGTDDRKHPFQPSPATRGPVRPATGASSASEPRSPTGRGIVSIAVGLVAFASDLYLRSLLVGLRKGTLRARRPPRGLTPLELGLRGAESIRWLRVGDRGIMMGE